MCPLRRVPAHRPGVDGPAPAAGPGAGGLRARQRGLGTGLFRLGTVTLRLGPYPVDPPVVLAPMAGITNVAFRQLCREHGAGLYVCELVTTRALVERSRKPLRMGAFTEHERPLSLQP